MLDYIFVFDIETIPDTESCSALTGCDNSDIGALRQSLTDYHLNITGGKNDFLRQPFHKVVAISYLIAKISKENRYERYDIVDIGSMESEESDEKRLVEGFFDIMMRYRPRLVSFNGRTFDLPVLKYRAMAHCISGEYLYKTGDRWNNYMQRYSQEWHCDLLEQLSDYGASARIKMHEVCAVLGIPGKFGVSGDKVSDLYDSGEINKIQDYCETDVLNTYLIYLRHMHHQGVLTKSSLDSCVYDLLNVIEKQSNKTHFLEFAKAWRKSSNDLAVFS